MKKYKDSISDYEKPIFNRGWNIGFLSLVLISVFALSIWNAAMLQIELDKSTQEYLTDVTSQLSRDIRDSINNKITNLAMAADSLSQFTESRDTDDISGFLTRKSQTLEFDPMILFDRKGGFVSSCSRSKFLSKLLKTFDKTFREIFPVFISTKRREKPSAFFDNNFVNNAYFSEAASSSSSHLASSSSKAPISSRMTCLCLWSS